MIILEEDWERVFRTSIYKFERKEVSAITGYFSFDILTFDEWAHTQGYSEEQHGSLADFIIKIYGLEAKAMIDQLLKEGVNNVQ